MPGAGLAEGWSFLVAVRDDVGLDAVVNVAGKYPAIEQIPLGAVGAKTHNAPGPAWRHARDFEQFISARVVDVDARLEGRN